MENAVLNNSSRGLVGSYKLPKMKGISAILFLSGLCALVFAEGLSEYRSPDSGKVFRPALDLKMVETRPTKQKSTNQQFAVRKPRPPSQIVYGKTDDWEIRPVSGKQRTANKKFKPSPQDPYFPPETLSYAPSHKYLQKYATQLYTTQKNSGQLSDYQKFILEQDPAVKKFVFSRATKKLNLDEVPTTKAATLNIVSSTASPVTTEKPRKEQKEVIGDSAAQSTAYKFVFQPEYIPVPVYTTHNKEPLLGYDTSALTAGQQLAHSYSLGDQFTYKIPTSSGHTVKHEDDHHEYPTKEPKYEFQYAVNDHEKKSNFGHAETRQGKRTWGKYYVQLSDGRLETVKYWADKTGYHAEVDFQGHAKHPQSKPKEVAPIHDFSAADLKLLGQSNVTPQFYSVSEHSPIELHH